MSDVGAMFKTFFAGLGVALVIALGVLFASKAVAHPPPDVNGVERRGENYWNYGNAPPIPVEPRVDPPRPIDSYDNQDFLDDMREIRRDADRYRYEPPDWLR